MIFLNELPMLVAKQTLDAKLSQKSMLSSTVDIYDYCQSPDSDLGLLTICESFYVCK